MSSEVFKQEFADSGISGNNLINVINLLSMHFSLAQVNDDVLNARMKWMLGAFERVRKCLPPLIIIIRDGISDGQYKHVSEGYQVIMLP